MQLTIKLVLFLKLVAAVLVLLLPLVNPHLQALCLVVQFFYAVFLRALLVDVLSDVLFVLDEELFVLFWELEH